MKKIIYIFLAMLPMSLGANAQAIEIYNGSTLDSCYNSPYKVVLGATSSDKTISVYNGGTLVKTYTGSSYSAKLTNKTYVTKITLNRNHISATTQGATYQLTALVAPETATSRSVTWKSSDESVATVDNNGLVSIVTDAFGSATITATAADGSGVTATCNVSVDAIAIEDLITITVLNDGEEGQIVALDAEDDEFTQSEIDKLAVAASLNEYFDFDVAYLLDKQIEDVNVAVMQPVVACNFDEDGDDVSVQIETAVPIEEDQKVLLMIGKRQEDDTISWESFEGSGIGDNKMAVVIPRETVLYIQDAYSTGNYDIMAILF